MTAMVLAAMRVAPVVSVVLAALALAACTSSAPAVPPQDAGLGPLQPLGGACDESLPRPCVILGDPCTASACDRTTHICIPVAVDGGPTCGGSPPPACTTECDAGLDAQGDAQGDAAPDAAPSDAAPIEAGEAGEDGGPDGASQGDAGAESDASGEAGDAASD